MKFTVVAVVVFVCMCMHPGCTRLSYGEADH